MLIALMTTAAIGAAVAVIIEVRAHQAHAAPSVPTPDQPPLEFIYLDANRVDSYLGQMDDGLPKTELRSAQSTLDVNAGISAGAAATIGANQSQQQGTQDTVTPTATDHFYLLLQLLRQKQGALCSKKAASDGACLRQLHNHAVCGGYAHPHWLTDITDTTGSAPLGAIECLGVGYFVRITNVQLFLPPYAQVLPNGQGTTALYGTEPWARTAFTSPTQSISPRVIRRYARAVAKDPRMPFIAAPYGANGRIGAPATTRAAANPSTGGKKGPPGKTATAGTIPIFLPADYHSLSADPSLLSGSATVVGKIVYFAEAGGPAYVDYSTIGQFVPALSGKRQRRFANELGVCDTKPPGAALVTSVAEAVSRAKATTRAATSHAPKKTRSAARARARAQRAARKAFAPDTCRNAAAIRKAVKASVTIKPPFAIVLPLAIYQ